MGETAAQARARRRRLNYSRKISVSISGHNTSVTLEPEFGAAFRQLAAERKCSYGDVAEFIDHHHRDLKSGQTLGSAVRCYLFSIERERYSNPAAPRRQKRALEFWAMTGKPA